MAEPFVTEVLESRSYREDAAGNIEGTRVFRIGGYGDAIACLRAPGVPQQYDYWPNENHIIVHGRDTRFVGGSIGVYEAIITYKPVYFASGDGLGALTGFDMDIAATQQWETIDLDGYRIGPCDNEGTSVWRPQSDFGIAVVLSKVEPLMINSLAGSVNAEPFLGADPGLVMFMGARLSPVHATRWNVHYRFKYHAVDVEWSPTKKGLEYYYWSISNDPKIIADPCAGFSAQAPCAPRIPFKINGEPCKNRVQYRKSFVPLFAFAIQYGF